MRPIFYIILVLAIATGAYFWISSNEKKNNANPNSNTVTEQPAEDPYKDWQAYATKSGIQFKIPSDWSIKEDERYYLALEVNQDNKSVGYFTAQKYSDLHGSETAGPKIDESMVLVDGIEAQQRVFEGDGILEEHPIEEKIYRDIILDFKKDKYFYGIKMRSKIEDKKFWQNVDLFIKSIEVK